MAHVIPARCSDVKIIFAGKFETVLISIATESQCIDERVFRGTEPIRSEQLLSSVRYPPKGVHIFSALFKPEPFEWGFEVPPFLARHESELTKAIKLRLAELRQQSK